ncbi:MAG: ATP-binding protein [Gammaproteobacteria bacterium]|nr:ATP-binding protein [Gammaproteobacteria bacterium]
MKKLFSGGISASSALIVLTLIVITHIIATYVVTDRSRVLTHRADRDEVIQKIVNTIQLVVATPVENRQHAINALEDPTLLASLTETPEYSLNFSELSFWAISRALHNNLDSFKISIKLDQAQWLNLRATVYSRFLLMQFLLIVLELIVFGAILFAAWSIHRFTGPLRQFKHAADQLGMDLHAKPLSIYGPNIVRETAQAMNTMQKRIQELIKDRTLMLAAISHDLRTPITRLKLRAQFIDNEELVEKIIHDLDEMESMISQTLSFAREDYSSKNKSKLDLVSILQSLCDDMHDMGHIVSLQTPEKKIPFLGRHLSLKRALSNIITNAIKYGHSADISINQNDQYITITVQDYGNGIPDNDLENVFKPFYRVDNSRSRNSTNGVGLGLAVAKEIIQHHGGTIQLSNQKNAGLCVTIILPCSPV